LQTRLVREQAQVMSSSREVELKLVLRRPEAARLLKQDFDRLGAAEGVKHHLVSVYFDTNIPRLGDIVGGIVHGSKK
jgi:hypothetical protein